MKISPHTLLAIIAASLLLSQTASAAPAFRYDYTAGSTYDTFITDPGFPGTNPYDDTHAVSGYFEVATALAPSTDYDFFLDGVPAGFSYSFSDGINTSIHSDAFDYFNIRTDALGNISQWWMFVYAPTTVTRGDYATISTGNCPDACDFHIIRDEGAVVSSAFDFALGRVFGSPGSWTVTEVSAVPLPAGVWLFGPSVFGLAAMARRKVKATEKIQ